MARDRRLWRAGKEQTPGAAPLRAVTGFATMAESIRISLPSGCGSFWLKEECSSLGVSPDTPPFGNSSLSFQKSSATRQMRIFRGSLYFMGVLLQNIISAIIFPASARSSGMAFLTDDNRGSPYSMHFGSKTIILSSCRYPSLNMSTTWRLRP